MPNQEKIELEMTYTSWEGSCLDKTITQDVSLRECRRSKKHDGKHASGFGSSHKQW